jgi:hypothetical protein
VAECQAPEESACAQARCVSPPRFLVDENLSILLPEVAHARGYEATHINHYGLRKSKDWDILKVVAEEDWILTTNNAFEFRGRYQRLEIHPTVSVPHPQRPTNTANRAFLCSLGCHRRISRCGEHCNRCRLRGRSHPGEPIRLALMTCRFLDLGAIGNSTIW